MADDNNQDNGTSTNTPVIDVEAINRINNIIDKMVESSKNVSSKLDTSTGKASSSLKDLQQSLTSVVQGSKDFANDFNNAATSAQKFNQVFNSISLNGLNVFDDFSKSALGAFKDVGDAALSVGNVIAKNILSSKDALSAAGTLAGTSFAESLKKTVLTSQIKGTDLSLDRVEDSLLSLDKIATQTALNFKGNYQVAASEAESFATAVAESIQATKATQEAVNSVSTTLGRYMDITEATRDVNDKFSKAVEGVNGHINALNAALLVSSATGQRAEEVAEFIGKAHYELGESIDQVVSSLGDIKSATEGSNVGFKTAADSIAANADALKLWGGTIQSVAPMFKTFANSLAGIGKEGLTPELLHTFVSGMASMSMSSKALVGLNLPGNARGGVGALQSGYQFEANMGSAEGMQKNLQAMMKTITQYTGGKITTLEEAGQSSEGARLYAIQQKFLTQFGISNTGSQKAISQIMKDIQSGGFKGTQDAQDKLQEALVNGQKAADDTTTQLVKAQNDTKSAILTSGQQIVNAIKGNMAGTQLQGILSGFDTTLGQAAAQGGISLEDLKSGFKSAMSGTVPLSEEELKSQNVQVRGNLGSIQKSEKNIIQNKEFTQPRKQTAVDKATLKNNYEMSSIISQFGSEKDQSTISALMKKKKDLSKVGQDLSKNEQIQLDQSLNAAKGSMAAFKSAKDIAQQQLQQRGANHGGSKRDQKQYQIALDELTMKNLEGIKKKFSEDNKNGQNDQIIAGIDQQLQMRQKDRMSLEQGNLSRAATKNIKNNFGKSAAKDAMEQFGEVFGGPTNQQIKEANAGIRMSGKIQKQTQNQEQEKNKGKDIDVGVRVKIVNGTVKIDKEFVREVAREVVKNSIGRPDKA